MEKASVKIILVLLAFGKVASYDNFTKFKNIIVEFDPDIYPKEHSPSNEDIDKMVATISKTFSKIKACTLKLFPNRRCEYAPIAAANYNLIQSTRNTSNPAFLEVYLSIHHKLENGHLGGNQSLFNFALGVAREANSIWNGTVKSIILGHEYLSQRHRYLIISDYLSMARNSKFGYEYKLGVYISTHECYEAWKWRNSNAASILSDLELAVVYAEPTEPDYSNGVKFFTTKILNDFHICLDMRAKWNFKVDIAFHTTWSDIDSNGLSNYSSLVYFWESMDKWSREKKVKVFLSAAFDTPRKSGKSAKRGWWLTINHTNMIFEEKQVAQNRLKENSDANKSITERSVKPHESLITPTPDRLQQHSYVSNNNHSTHHENVIVCLNPYISTGGFNERLNEADVAKMVETVSKSFTKIATVHLVDNYKRTAAEYIVRVAALQNARSSNQSNNSGPVKFLEVFVFSFHSATDGLLQGSRSLFNRMFDEAENANRIWNGTVKTLLFEIDAQLDEESLLQIISNYLSMLRNAQSNFLYTLGVFISPRLCHKAMHNNTMGRLLSSLKLAVVYQNPSYNDIEMGVEMTSKRYQASFQHCLDVVKKLKLDVEIAFQTSWSDKSLNGLADYSALLYFWEAMESWSEKIKVKVIMYFAFDTHMGAGLESRKGWWRTVEYAGLIFEEKRITLQKQLGWRRANASSNLKSFEPPPSKKNEESRVQLISAIVSPFVSIIMIGLFIVFIYRKLSDKIEHPSLLTKQDVEDFLGGHEADRETGILSSALALPYNKELELSWERFEIKNDEILGLGNFGIVCKANLKFANELIVAAAKKLKSNLTATALKGLLSEIKVLSHLGKHENIICLLGANTERLKDGDVLVFTELCVNGSLDKYLRSEKPVFCTHAGGHYDSLEQGIEAKAFCKNNLHYKWSCEIARGMEYVASKSVVHADLATRNVLLDKNLTAKISDFGLSRRLYEYESYQKNEEEPMPWRWMSPESLSKLIFNEKTDVWAFGITLWEIYTLASVPYGGLVWNANFYKRLIEGLRLDQPENCPDQIFEIMMACWDVGPNQRPNFREVVQRLI